MLFHVVAQFFLLNFIWYPMNQDMKMSIHPSTYKVYFRDHDIPSISTTAICRDQVFYFHEHHLRSYSLSTSSHSKVFPVKNSSFLTVLKDTLLCNVSGNLLTIVNTTHSTSTYPSKHSEVVLKEMPIQILKYNDSCNHYLGFLYSESIEIFKVRENASMEGAMNKQSPGLLIEVKLPFKTKSMACTGDDTYILTEENQILRCKSIFVAQCITLVSKIKYISEGVEDFHKIYAFQKFIFVKTDKSILKYEILGDALLLQYTFAIQNSGCEIVQDFLLSDSLVHLSKAPFMIVKDKIYGLEQGVSEYIAVSPGRIYFLSGETNVEQDSSYRPRYEMNDYKITINPQLIKIPDFIKDEQQKEQFLNNSIRLKKYESILEVLRKIDIDLDVREREGEKEYRLINEKLELLKNRRDEMEERAKSIRKRAGRVMFKGDLTSFYEKMKILENFLQKLPVRKFDSLKNRLKAQKAVLKDKAL